MDEFCEYCEGKELVVFLGLTVVERREGGVAVVRYTHACASAYALGKCSCK